MPADQQDMRGLRRADLELAGGEHRELVRRARVPRELDRALDHEHRALRNVVRDRDARARLEMQIDEERLAGMADRRRRTERGADQHATGDAIGGSDRGQRGFRVMLEGRLDVLVRRGQREPDLDAVHQATRGAKRGIGALGVHDAAPRRHQVEVERAIGLDGAEAVAMHVLACEEVGHGRQADVRMRAHVEPGTRWQRHRPHVIEEHERPHHPPLRRGEEPRHDHVVPEIARPAYDHELDGVGAVMTGGIVRGHVGHENDDDRKRYRAQTRCRGVTTRSVRPDWQELAALRLHAVCSPGWPACPTTAIAASW